MVSRKILDRLNVICYKLINFEATFSSLAPGEAEDQIGALHTDLGILIDELFCDTFEVNPEILTEEERELYARK